MVLNNGNCGHEIGVFWSLTCVGVRGILPDSDAADELHQTLG